MISFDGISVPAVVFSGVDTLLLVVLYELILSVVRASLGSATNRYMISADQMVAGHTRWL